MPFSDGKGEDGGDGQESKCAVELDSQAGVKHWIRNIPKHPNAFWLRVSLGKFYSDFVAELEDGRVLVVEYKGQRIKHDPKEIKKVQVGKLWQNVSKGQGVFVQVEVEVDDLNMREQIAKAIG